MWKWFYRSYTEDPTASFIWSKNNELLIKGGIFRGQNLAFMQYGCEQDIMVANSSFLKEKV